MAVRMWGQVVVQDTMPAEAPVMVGTLWTGTGEIKVCTSISPYTFASVSGGSIAWADIVDFAGSSLANLATRSASDLSSGTLPDARFPATLPALNASLLTALNAAVLASGTIPDARFPSTLPALNGSLLTALNASALGSGTVPDARFPATLPALNGSALTALNASNLASGTVPDARFPATLPAANGSALTNLAAANLTGSIAVARLANGTTTVLTSTTTSNQNNWAPGLVGNTTIFWSGAGDIVITGFAGGVSGQIVGFVNTGTNIATFVHQSGSSSAGNKFRNIATSAATPVAAGGYVFYQYDGTDWRLIAHEQGAWITQTFAAGDYTGNGSMTWTVSSGNAIRNTYKLTGKDLAHNIYIANTSVGGTLNTQLRLKVPGGFSMATDEGGAIVGIDNATAIAGAAWIATAGTNVLFTKPNSGNWSSSGSATLLIGSMRYSVT